MLECTTSLLFSLLMKKPLFLLIVGTLGGAALSFVVQLLLARMLGASVYGIFASVLTIVNVLTPLAGFGVSAYWLKVFGEEGWMAIRWIKPSLKFTILSLVLVMLVLCLYALFVEKNAVSQRLLLIMSFVIIGQLSVEFVSSLLQLEERYTQLAVWQFLPHLLRLIVICVLFTGIIQSDLIQFVAIGFALVAVLITLISIGKVLRAVNGRVKLAGHGLKKYDSENVVIPSIGNVFSNVLPFGLAGFFYLLYFQSAIVIVNWLLGAEDAGQYGVMITIMTAIYLLPTIIYNKFLLPKIHRWAYHNNQQFEKVYKQGNLAMLALGGVVAISLMLVPTYVVPILLGDSYLVVNDLLFFVAFAVPFRFLASSLGAFLITKENMRVKVIAMGVTAIISVVINFIMINAYGLTGAAISIVFVDAALCMLYYLLVKVCVFRN